MIQGSPENLEIYQKAEMLLEQYDQGLPPGEKSFWLFGLYLGVDDPKYRVYLDGTNYYQSRHSELLLTRYLFKPDLSEPDPHRVIRCKPPIHRDIRPPFVSIEITDGTRLTPTRTPQGLLDNLNVIFHPDKFRTNVYWGRNIYLFDSIGTGVVLTASSFRDNVESPEYLKNQFDDFSQGVLRNLKPKVLSIADFASKPFRYEDLERGDQELIARVYNDIDQGRLVTAEQFRQQFPTRLAHIEELDYKLT